MDCPACKTESLSMTERQGIEIDYCPKCRGVWLDRGELDKIIERAGVELASAGRAPMAAAPAQAPAPAAGGYGQQDKYGHRDDRYRSGHHKKSFWHEIFD